MRHRRGNRKLSRATDQRLAMLRSIVRSLFLHGRVESTLARAKEASRLAEKLIAGASESLEGGGVGLKGSDYMTIPLCRLHHDEYHNVGRTAFQKANTLDVYYSTTLCLAGFVRKLLSQ